MTGWLLDTNVLSKLRRPKPDLIIAATALHHGMTVVSRDLAGFDGTGAIPLDPWQPVPP